MNNVYRNDVIVENFFYYLKKYNVSQTQYEIDNNLSKGTLSKWKNKTVNITVEQLYIATLSFGITINDLIYDEKQKKNIVLLNNNDNEKKVTNKVEKVKFFTNSIEYCWSSIIIVIALFFALFALCWYFDIYGILCVFPVFIIFLNKKFPYYNCLTYTYTINHLDSITFKLDDEVNYNFKKQIFLRVLSTILIISLIVPLIFMLIDLFKNFYNEVEFNPNIFLISLFTVLGLANLFAFKSEFIPKVKYDKIYNQKLDYFSNALNCFLASAFLLAGIICIAFHTAQWYLLMFSIPIFIIDIVELVIIRKKMLEYKAVYQRYGRKGVNLFPWE